VIVFDCADLDDDVMLAIAREMNLSDAEEIPLAGHPTIAEQGHWMNRPDYSNGLWRFVFLFM